MSVIRSYNELKKSSIDIPQYINEGSKANIPADKMDSFVLSKDKYLLNYLSAYCDSANIQLKEIAQTYFSGKDSILIETNKIVFEGNYQDVLALIYSIEKEKKIAAITAATWELSRDRTTNTSSLLSTLYIKQLIYEK